MDKPEILQDGYQDKKVDCPHCSSANCFESTEEATETISYLCLRCGYTTNTYFYTRKRASQDYWLADGYYKVTHDSSTYKSIQITNGKIASLNTCR